MLYTNEAIKNRKEKTNKIKKLFITIIYILLIPMLIYNISLVFQAVINPNETPSFFGIKMYVIVSGSMKPEIDVGDIVVVKKENEELKKDDIISFRKGQTIITHRIVEVVETENEKQYKTKGDNNNVADVELVKLKNIEGKVIKKISSFGNVVLVFKDKTLIITLVICYYVYLVHEQSVKKKKMLRKIKREEYENKRQKESLDEGEKY